MPGDASRSALLRFAHDLLDETDAIALRLIEGPLAVTTKPKQALVTRVDTEIETHLRDRIGVAHPGHAVLGEEFGTADDAGHGRWIIDPIDATTTSCAASTSSPRSSPSSGMGSWRSASSRLRRCVGAGSPLVGTAPTSAPRRGSGRSACRRSPRSRRRRSCSRRSAGSTPRGLGDGLRRLTARAWRDRGFGDFWGHMLVAQGSAEAMLEYGVAPWDMAAPYLMVTEAGGRMTDLSGMPSWTSPQALTTNGRLHAAIVDQLTGGCRRLACCSRPASASTSMPWLRWSTSATHGCRSSSTTSSSRTSRSGTPASTCGASASVTGVGVELLERRGAVAVVNVK